MTVKRSTPVRVLELVSGLAIEETSGGVARFVTELALAIDRRRVQPYVAAIWDYQTRYDQMWCDRLSVAGIPTLLAATWNEERPYRSCINGVINLWQGLKVKVDIVHSHGEFSDLAAVAIQRKVGASHLVRTVHNEFEWGKRPMLGKLFPNWLYPWFFQAELGVSRRTANNLDRRPLARLLGKSTAYVPNALNFARFDKIKTDVETLRGALGVPSGAIVIGSVGRLVRQKGYDVLLAAAPAVLANCPDARFVIVGAGVMQESLAAQARALGIDGQVIFTGSRSDVADVLKTFDLFVSPSRYEGLPTVMLEAIAAGIPIVATQVSGNSELIEHGVSGLLVPPEDATTLADAIVAMLSGQAPRAEMARRAGDRARKLYTMDAIAQQYADFYCLLMGSHDAAVAT